MAAAENYIAKIVKKNISETILYHHRINACKK